MLIMLGIGDKFHEAWISLWMAIDSLLYTFVGYAYRIFLLLSKFNPFSVDTYKTLVQNIYIVIGVAMLFALTYSLLKAVINPDDFSKGDSTPQKILVNIITSIIIIIVLPTGFKYIGYFQDAVIDNDIIGKVIIGPNSNTSNTLNNGGYVMAEKVFEPFFQPNSDYCDKGDYKTTDDCAKSIELDDPYDANGTTVSNLSDAYSALQSTGDFFALNGFLDNIQDKDISYLYFISSAAAVFLFYVIISFCFDLGIRVVKLAFLQIIAPVPVICRAIPKGKDIFNNWSKMLFSVYLEVFVRIGAMDIGVQMITLFIRNTSWLSSSDEKNPLILMLANAFVILGVIAFVKEVPKMLSKLFPGLDSGNMKLGIKDKLAAGGAFAIGGAVGAGGAYAANKLAHMPGNLKKFKNDLKNANSTGAKAKIWANAVGNRFGNGLRFGRSVVSGGVNAKGAKDLKSMNSAAKKGAVSGLTAPGVIQDAKNGVVDTYQALSTFNKTEFSPVASKRSIEQANKLDEVKKKHDLVIDALDKSDNVKAIDDFYEGQIKQLRESGGYTDENGKFISYTSDELIGQLSNVQKEWRGKKDTAREVALKEKMTVNDFEMNGLLQSYAATLKENENILVEAHSKVKGEKLSDEAFDNVTQDMANNFKTFNELGKSAGKYSGELRRIAIEEEQKNNSAK